jgi:hypothetical protein
MGRRPMTEASLSREQPERATPTQVNASPPSGVWNVLVCGLPLADDSFDLGSSFALRRLKAKLTVFDLAAAGAVGFREWATLEPIAASATAEIMSTVTAAEAPGYDALNKCWLVSALLVIRGFARHICPACSGYSWNFIAGIRNLRPLRFICNWPRRGRKRRYTNHAEGCLTFAAAFSTIICGFSFPRRQGPRRLTPRRRSGFPRTLKSSIHSQRATSVSDLRLRPRWTGGMRKTLGRPCPACGPVLSHCLGLVLSSYIGLRLTLR